LQSSFQLSALRRRVQKRGSTTAGARDGRRRRPGCWIGRPILPGGTSRSRRHRR